MRKFVIAIIVVFLVFGTVLLSSCERSYTDDESATYNESGSEHNMETSTEDTADYIITDEVTYVDVNPLTFQDVLHIANARRYALLRPDLDIVTRLTEGRISQTIDVSLYSANEEIYARGVSSEEAVYDAQILFDIIRQVYGAYIYFGGDDVFLPIFDNVTETLKSVEFWEFSDFSQLLYENLAPVIHDNHFSLDSRVLGVTYDFFGGRDEFDLTESGYRNRANGLYIEMVEGFDVDDIFRLKMSREGEFFFSPIVMTPHTSQTTYYLTVIYACGTEDIITLWRERSSRIDYQPSSLRWVEGFPIVTLREMGHPESTYGFDSESARRFLSMAEELQDEPVIIIDIRSNGGGNGLLHSQWLHILLGEMVSQNYFGLRVGDSEFVRESAVTPYTSGFFQTIETFDAYASPVPFGDYHTLMYPEPGRVVQNDRLIVLLVDRFSASAADSFADSIINLENTLIIGHNTSGALHTDLTYPHLQLPNSGLQFGLGRTIHIHPEGHLQEGIGIAPDIWFSGSGIITAVVDMLEANFVGG